MENININIGLLINTIDNGPLTPIEFIFLFYLLQDKTFEHVKEVDINKLEELKLIKIFETKIIPRDYKIKEFLNEISTNIVESIVEKPKENDDNLEECWKKLVSLYPTTDEGRVINRTKVTGLPKLKIAIKEDGFDTIIKGLKTQLIMREKALKNNKFFDGMQGLSTWLYQKTYLNYVNLVVEDKSIDKFETI